MKVFRVKPGNSRHTWTFYTCLYFISTEDSLEIIFKTEMNIQEILTLISK